MQTNEDCLLCVLFSIEYMSTLVFAFGPFVYISGNLNDFSQVCSGGGGVGGVVRKIVLVQGYAIPKMFDFQHSEA